MAPIGPSKCVVRVVVEERRAVADLLAGGPVEVLALRAWREAPDERIEALIRAQGAALSGDEIEVLRREGGLRRAA